MARKDIRTSGEAATIKHHSARGKVKRNSGNFTRGSQLLTHELLMTWAGVKIPGLILIFSFLILLSLTLSIRMNDSETSLVIMGMFSRCWLWMSLDPLYAVNLTLPSGSIVQMSMAAVKENIFVEVATAKAIKCTIASLLGSFFVSIPITVWFIDISRRRGTDILLERHERGAMLVNADILINEVRNHNLSEFKKECSEHSPPVDPSKVLKLPMSERTKRGFHAPYIMAGVPIPWRLEQTHTMLIGTTGTGKTTELRSLVKQARARNHGCVIFDLTGAFVSTFYDPEKDYILNPMDERCQPWTLFNDCFSYSDFTSAAQALIAGNPNGTDAFWEVAARTLFVEMCVKLTERKETSNAALSRRLMQATLSEINAMLSRTNASPLVSLDAARMAESIRAVYNVNGNSMSFLPDPGPKTGKPFSINTWMQEEAPNGSILFITSNHNDLSLTRSLLTLWMDLAVSAIMRLPRTRQLRVWFMFDEVHALHRLPAIETGLQTARAYGGAFILGMHSFGALCETYGEDGAVHLTSLARTKLIFATGDDQTATKCSEFIGNREVRQMDEAYSYGYNESRDASTLTPTTTVKPLVIPDDIMNLPNLTAYIKFPEGFPAALTVIKWKNYPEIAEPFKRKDHLNSAPVAEASEETDTDGQPASSEGGQGVEVPAAANDQDGPVTGDAPELAIDDEQSEPGSDENAALSQNALTSEQTQPQATTGFIGALGKEWAGYQAVVAGPVSRDAAAEQSDHKADSAHHHKEAEKDSAKPALPENQTLREERLGLAANLDDHNRDDDRGMD